jgi:hypothetical protein
MGVCVLYPLRVRLLRHLYCLRICSLGNISVMLEYARARTSAKALWAYVVVPRLDTVRVV